MQRYYFYIKQSGYKKDQLNIRDVFKKIISYGYIVVILSNIFAKIIFNAQTEEASKFYADIFSGSI